jgi:hypothetical protein
MSEPLQRLLRAASQDSFVCPFPREIILPEQDSKACEKIDRINFLTIFLIVMDIRMQLQLHEHVRGPEARGV